MTYITQAIETKHLPATNNRGSRIKATAWAGSVTVSYDHGLNADDNHRAAAQVLIAKFGWTGTFAQGGNAKGNGFYFVNVEGAPDLLAALHGVDEACQQGLNSSEPVHWEAALQDVMELVRAAIIKAT